MLIGGPLSYNDPLYARLAAEAEQRYGLPAGILDAIRTRGERSNANQTSPAGARGVYQFIPSTRQGFVQKYHVDPWSGPEAQTQAAALHVLDDYKRTKSWDEAIARYNGGQHPGRSAHAYAAKVGHFDQPDVTQPYYAGNNDMSPSLYPVVNGMDPLAPEAPTMPVPMNVDPGPSPSMQATAAPVARKRGGILGALESIFMPDPGSQWAGALRDGLTNAKESQQLYRENQASKQLELQTANAKLHQMLQKGEFQIVGNNIFHVLPSGQQGQDGKGYELITPPTTPTDKERMFQQWQAAPDGSPAKQFLERLLLGAQSDEAQANARTIQNLRGSAAIRAAKVRGSISNPGLPPLPPGATVVR
jgi:hypothetical protein